jgi:hypothetical protein
LAPHSSGASIISIPRAANGSRSIRSNRPITAPPAAVTADFKCKPDCTFTGTVSSPSRAAAVIKNFTPSSLVRPVSPTNNRCPKRSTSPPSSIAGSVMISSSKSVRNGSIESPSARRDGAPGRVITARRSSTTTGSSTNTESGASSSRGSAIVSTPASSSART